jgi:hypothetical protein
MDRPTKPSGRHAVRLRWDEIITRLSFRFNFLAIREAEQQKMKEQGVNPEAKRRAEEQNRNVGAADKVVVAVATASKASANLGPPSLKADAAEASAGRQTTVRPASPSRSWFDVKSWSYLKIAVAALPAGMIGGWMIAAGFYVGNPTFSAYRVFYAAAILLLMTKLTSRPAIAKLVLAFITLHILFFVTSFAQNFMGPPTEIVRVLCNAVSMALLWFTMASVFRSSKDAVQDKKMLAIATGNRCDSSGDG